MQQHLQGDETGCFVDGSIQWGETAQNIRARIKERLRLVYHMPLPFTVRVQRIFIQISATDALTRQAQDLLLSLQREPDLYPSVQPFVSMALVRLSGRTEYPGNGFILTYHLL